MFSSDLSCFVIDLNTPPSQRWAEVIAHKQEAALALMAEAEAEFRRVPELARWLFSRLYQRTGGLYQEEMAAWASGLGVSVGTVTMLNCAYELSHLHIPRLLGCTAGVRWVEGKGMVHVRTLDWPLASMGGATCLFRFHKGSREFVVVGVPGQVGVLSGMVPGAFSVTINWAPPGAFPTFEFGPTFLLREVLETHDHYDAAVKTLTETELATSVFFTVCGTEPGQGCVIERTQTDAVVRPMNGPTVVQANHHSAEPFVRHNAMIVRMENAEFLAESSVRAEKLAQCLTEAGDVLATLDVPPVLNKDTVQKMLFCPRTGDVQVWRRVAAG
jgi:hypothetical protein